MIRAAHSLSAQPIHAADRWTPPPQATHYTAVQTAACVDRLMDGELVPALLGRLPGWLLAGQHIPIPTFRHITHTNKYRISESEVAYRI